MKDTKFTKEQQKIWTTLFKRKLPKVKKFACKEFLDGFEILKLNPNKIPSVFELNQKITPLTGWKIVRTSVRYTDAVTWYKNHFAKREFLVTDFLRSWKELDFTPEPDMFHDVFGHQPFMVLPGYTDLQDMFAPAFLSANEEQREDIKRLAWFSTEFGLIREQGRIKIFGAGLMSSSGEMENVLSGKVPLREFTIENVLKRDKAMWSFNEELFVINSIDELKKELKKYFDTIK